MIIETYKIKNEIEINIAQAQRKILALRRDRDSKVKNAIDRAKRGDAKAITWKGQKIAEIDHEIEKMDYFIKGLITAQSLITQCK